MEVYNSEQEQVEALKAWWDKNGRSALTGLAVFLASVLGWQYWGEYRDGQAAGASAQYQAMSELMNRDSAAAMDAGRAVIANYPDSIYAVMASLSMAKLAVAENDLDAAAAHLRSAMDKSDQPEFAALARLRLARVEFAQNKADAALATLAGGEGGAASDELRGDILLSQGKQSEARTAYASALNGYSDLPDKRSLVQTKLDDLAAESVTE